jgi:uncharacterized protein (DUF2141 family)
MNYVLLVATLLLTPPLAAAEPPAPGLAIRLSGFHSDEGQVLLTVYRGEDGFPGDPDRAWKRIVAKISGGRASVDLQGVPPGDYAIAVVHDENANNALDTSWIGIPKEGIGTSNNAKGRMGPPKYRDAKFTVTAAGAVQSIKMLYL